MADLRILAEKGERVTVGLDDNRSFNGKVLHPCLSSASPLSPSYSSDEEFLRDEFFDGCPWEYVPEFTTEPAMSRAMAEFGYIPLVKRHRHVGRQEVERLQEEESDRKLIVSLYPWLPQ